ncbi:MAG: DNA cytosine methyltransferase [Candidatus Schekmanbacteria bacterium]|nr:DNA cytosine methyltransferase [Candidatus Schekmanbacteria bacterium]
MSQRKAISIFTGAGGLDLGFEAAGFTTAIAVEMDSAAISTLRHNREWPIIGRDIHSVPSSELLKVASLREGDADVLIGGPPCQPFSKSGYWASGDTLRLDDPRAGTLAAYLRILRDALPRAFLLENVPGLSYRGKSEGLLFLEHSLENINKERGTHYRLNIAELNAADYGAPQLRERIFVVGGREGQTFQFPAPTHQPLSEGGRFNLMGIAPYTTAWDAIGDLEEDGDPELQLSGKWADLLPSIPEGDNYLWHTARGGGLQLFGWRRRFWSFLLKLSKSKPSWTIQAQPGPAIGPFHWKNRRLSAREMCRLQTFPDQYHVLGNIASAQRQIGNAVPSVVAQCLAGAIRRQILGDNVPAVATLTPRRREPVPDPEPALPVPEKYRFLVGEYSAHPGTGRGNRAAQRNQESVDAADIRVRAPAPPSLFSAPRPAG